MNGIIQTYLEEKNYGFIKGNDNKDYFFHSTNVKSKNEKIIDGSLVTFNQKATSKGYAAIDITIVSNTDHVKYNVPNEIYTSKSNSIKGWETIQLTHWSICSSSRSSPDEAKRDLINKAKLINANAVLDITYYKTTGSEAGTGHGIHRYTIHNFRGRLANIGKKNLNGEVTKERLNKLDINAQNWKNMLVKKTKKAKMERLIFWVIFIAIDIVVFFVNDSAGLVVLGLMIVVLFLYNFDVDFDSWLRRL